MKLMMPDCNIGYTLGELSNRDGETIYVAPGSGHVVHMRQPESVHPTFDLLMKAV